jgi:DNA (cytosine-5)-methyltransferase 1
VNLDLFAGPGGWSEAARMLGLPEVGIELDKTACATRAAAGHVTVRADVSAFPVHRLRDVIGLIGSPPCVVFSAAGKRAGVAVTDLLADLVRDNFAGRKTRARHRKLMARALRAAWWPSPKITRERRSAAIRKAVLSASLVAEPARFIAACRPEWVALEQVPAVLPLWKVYADELRKLGYSVWCGKLNAANYGVPQTRERAILIASRVRRVSCPPPTHYDPRRGAQLFGDPWVSMATALGWGATGRPPPTVTAGGTRTGGAEPFGHRDREALEAERDAGRWTLRLDTQSKATLPRSADEPAPTMQFAHRANLARWVLHTNRGQDEDGTRQTVDPSTAPAPAPALTAKSGGQWIVKSFRNNNNNNACERSLDEPAGTLFFGRRSNWAAWVAERPATTVQGDPLAGRPGHKDRDLGESQFEQDSVRITVQEAAILQSFPPDYPWQGTKTTQFRQVGDAVPPLLAMHILAEASGVPAAAEQGAA